MTKWQNLGVGSKKESRVSILLPTNAPVWRESADFRRPGNGGYTPIRKLANIHLVPRRSSKRQGAYCQNRYPSPSGWSGPRWARPPFSCGPGSVINGGPATTGEGRPYRFQTRNPRGHQRCRSDFRAQPLWPWPCCRPVDRRWASRRLSGLARALAPPSFWTVTPPPARFLAGRPTSPIAGHIRAAAEPLTTAARDKSTHRGGECHG